MKKLKLGKLDAKVLTERDLKNILGGLAAPSSTVVTNTGSGQTQCANAHDWDSATSDEDGPNPPF